MDLYRWFHAGRRQAWIWIRHYQSEETIRAINFHGGADTEQGASGWHGQATEEMHVSIHFYVLRFKCKWPSNRLYTVVMYQHQTVYDSYIAIGYPCSMTKVLLDPPPPPPRSEEEDVD